MIRDDEGSIIGSVLLVYIIVCSLYMERTKIPQIKHGLYYPSIMSLVMIKMMALCIKLMGPVPGTQFHVNDNNPF